MMRFFELDFTRRPKKPHQIITLSFSEVFSSRGSGQANWACAKIALSEITPEESPRQKKQVTNAGHFFTILCYEDFSISFLSSATTKEVYPIVLSHRSLPDIS